MLKQWANKLWFWLVNLWYWLTGRPTLTTLGRLTPDKPLEGNPNHFIVTDASQGGSMEVRASSDLGITEEEHRMILGLPPLEKR